MEALVTSVLDGYNVCIMAYGQTGSGKTFTMEGPDGDPGVNARALQELFRCAAPPCERALGLTVVRDGRGGSWMRPRRVAAGR